MANAESTLTNQVIADETVKAWSELWARVRSDETLKQRLVDSPAAVLHEHGIEVPSGIEIRVVENTDKVSYLTLPAKGAQGELTADELTQVSGGSPLLVAGAAFCLALGFASGAAIANGGAGADAIKLAKDYANKKPK